MQQRTFVVSRSAALVCAATLFALLPSVSQALGVGELKLQSALSEPFRAEIALTAISPKDLKTLKAHLVSPAHLAAGELPQGAPITREILVRIANGPDGRHVLELYSDQSIREPYVRFLLQLDWAGGRLTREFTALLDPRPGAAESDVAGPELQTSPSTDTQTVAVEDSPPVVDTTGAGVASAPPPIAAKTAEPEETRPPLDAKPDDAQTKKIGPSATKSEQGSDTSTHDQRERLASEIKTWAQTHTRPQTSKTEAEADTPAVARNTREEMKRKIAEHERANADAPQPRQTTLLAWVLDHTNELLMATVALVALLLVGFGTAWLMLTWRPQPTPSIHLQSANLDPTVVVEKRQRGGRRRQFIPVAIERRRGPRRQSDLPQPALAPIDASETGGDFDPDDPVERELKEEISKHPERLGLKLKLLALYHSRNDKTAFETLLNNIYAAAENQAASNEEGWPRFEDYDDLAASDGAAPILTTVSPPQPDDARTNTGQDSSSANDDAPAPTVLDSDIPEYPLLMDEQSWTNIDEDLLDLQDAVVEYEPPEMGNLTAGPAETIDSKDLGQEALQLEDADTGDFKHEALHVDDLSDIRKIVEQGMDVVDRNNGDHEDAPSTKERGAKKNGKRKRKSGSSRKSKAPAAGNQEKGLQWRDPAKKIDLAKAYIDMGDAERARHILDEVLQQWDRGDGTDG